MNLDKFYTRDDVAKDFVGWVDSYLDLSSYEHILEPSAGAGAILQYLPEKAKGIDLLPEGDGIEECDFFDYEYPDGKVLTIGNPPFGSRSKLAIEFFKKASKHSEAIAFIIPCTWEKYSIHKLLPEGWALIANKRLPEDGFTAGGKPYRVRCVSQIWVKSDAPGIRLLSKPTSDNPWFDFVTKEECDFAIRQAYPKTVLKQDIDDQSHYYIKPKTQGVFEVFDSIQWQSVENKKLLGGTKIPCLDKETVVKFFMNYRKEEKEQSTHPDFTFVSKSEDWDFCMSGSPAIVRSREYFEEKNGAFCTIFIKSTCDPSQLFEDFNTIAWQSKEAKEVLSGSRFPSAGPEEVVRIYDLWKDGVVPSKKGDWRVQKEQAKYRKKHEYQNYRKEEKEQSTHPDFKISSKYNPNATFVIRGVRPVISDEVDIYLRISPNTRYYSVEPLVDGVKEVFESIEWKDWWQGVSLPSVSIPDCIEAYCECKKKR